MVAGEHAEPAGIDRDGAVQPELGAEVRDRLLGVLGPLLGKPGAGARLLVPEPIHHLVVVRRDTRITRGSIEALGGDLVEELQRIVMDVLPEAFIDGAEDDARFAVPAPGQVAGDVGERGEAIGNQGGHEAVMSRVRLRQRSGE